MKCQVTPVVFIYIEINFTRFLLLQSKWCFNMLLKTDFLASIQKLIKLHRYVSHQSRKTIRNIGILAHIDAGKNQLARIEAYDQKIISRVEGTHFI